MESGLRGVRPTWCREITAGGGVPDLGGGRGIPRRARGGERGGVDGSVRSDSPPAPARRGPRQPRGGIRLGVQGARRNGAEQARGAGGRPASAGRGLRGTDEATHGRGPDLPHRDDPYGRVRHRGHGSDAAGGLDTPGRPGRIRPGHGRGAALYRVRRTRRAAHTARAVQHVRRERALSARTGARSPPDRGAGERQDVMGAGQGRTAAHATTDRADQRPAGVRGRHGAPSSGAPLAVRTAGSPRRRRPPADPDRPGTGRADPRVR